MKEDVTPFALALQKAGIRSQDFCRAVEKLTGREYSPTMPSRWVRGIHDAPPPALALAILLGRLPEDELKELIQGPPRKKYTRRKTGGVIITRTP